MMIPSWIAWGHWCTSLMTDCSPTNHRVTQARTELLIGVGTQSYVGPAWPVQYCSIRMAELIGTAGSLAVHWSPGLISHCQWHMNGGDDPLWTLGPFNPMIGWCPMQYEPSIPIGVFVFTPITLFQGALPFSLSWVRAQNQSSTPTNQVIRGELATKVELIHCKIRSSYWTGEWKVFSSLQTCNFHKHKLQSSSSIEPIEPKSRNPNNEWLSICQT